MEQPEKLTLEVSRDTLQELEDVLCAAGLHLKVHDGIVELGDVQLKLKAWKSKAPLRDGETIMRKR